MSESTQSTNSKNTVFGITLTSLFTSVNLTNKGYREVLERCHLSAAKVESIANRVINGEIQKVTEQTKAFVDEFCVPGGATRPEIRALFLQIRKEYKNQA